MISIAALPAFDVFESYRKLFWLNPFLELSYRGKSCKIPTLCLSNRAGHCVIVLVRIRIAVRVRGVRGRNKGNNDEQPQCSPLVAAGCFSLRSIQMGIGGRSVGRRNGYFHSFLFQCIQISIRFLFDFSSTRRPGWLISCQLVFDKKTMRMNRWKESV